MKSEERSIKKRIKRRIELPKQINKMSERQRLRTTGKPKPINVGLMSRSEIRSGVIKSIDVSKPKPIGVSKPKSILEIKEPISIIITAWQTQDYIEECLDSIENQTYFINNNYEILIGVDACQNTLNKLLEIRHKYRNLKIFMMDNNMGTYVTTNTLLSLIKFENILRFDSDDIMKPEMINEIMYYVNDYDLIQFGFSKFNNNFNNVYDAGFSYANGCIFYKKTIFDIAGGYQNWVCGADTELLNRIKKHVKHGIINKRLFYLRVHKNSLTAKIDINVRNKLKIKKSKNVKIIKVINKYNLIEIPFDYDICVVITTFNRKESLMRLLSDIDKNKGNYKILTIVFDDSSTNSLDLTDFDVKYIRYYVNHGKKQYWKLMSDTMQFCEYINSKYFIYLPDDVTLVDNFFMKSIESYENIQEDNKICLSLLLIKQQIGNTNWTDFKPIEYDNYYKTQWCDLCFISEKKLFNILDYKIDEVPLGRWKNNKNLSSGVGRDLSKRLYNLGYNMYHVKNTLVLHGDHDSVMNKDLREKEKLTT